MAATARLRRLVVGSLLVMTATSAGAAADLDLTAYKATLGSGSAEHLRRKLDEETEVLRFDPQFGFLSDLLRELQISPASQLLVASKTSPNKHHISPRNPRALYFSENTAVAFVPGAEVIEIATADPRLGVAFYTLDQKAGERPRIVRDDRCLECHASAKTLGAPGWLVRSFRTDADGEVDLLSGLMVTHRTPIAERWGGYYVTGDTGGQPHRGNQFESKTTKANPVKLRDLAGAVDLQKYPEGTSDVVALMVLEHQVQMMNLLTRLRLEAEALGEKESFDRASVSCEDVLKYMLFLDEAPLAAPVRGNLTFSKSFESAGKSDNQGRSLRQFDLRTRLFKYRCSYMIYSPSFEALPQRAKRHLYRRLWEVLAGEDTSPPFQILTAEEKAAAREILVQTKADLPAYWRL